jgi:hypothetical protein
MNSKLPWRTVSPREKPLRDKCSLSVEETSANEGTIETSRGKARYKSPFLAHQLSMFSAPTNYVVVKITTLDEDLMYMID